MFRTTSDFIPSVKWTSTENGFKTTKRDGGFRSRLERPWTMQYLASFFFDYYRDREPSDHSCQTLSSRRVPPVGRRRRGSDLAPLPSLPA